MFQMWSIINMKLFGNIMLDKNRKRLLQTKQPFLFIELIRISLLAQHPIVA